MMREERGHRQWRSRDPPRKRSWRIRTGAVTLHSPIKVRVTKTIDGVEKYTTRRNDRRPHHLQRAHPAGSRLCGSYTIPSMRSITRSASASTKKSSAKSSTAASRRTASPLHAEVLDSIKAQGYKYLHPQRHDRLHRGHGRPRGEKGKDRRDREEGPRDRKAVQARSYHQRRTLPHGRR